MEHFGRMSVPARAARERRLGTVAVALVLIASACSGDGDSTEATTAPTTVPADTTAAPATTATPADTTAPATTTVPETTVASTTTSVPPTTTLAPDASTTTTVADPEVQAVIDALVASWTAFGELLMDPFDDDKIALLAELERGDALAASLGVVEDFRVRNLRTVRNTDLPSEIVPLPATVGISGAEATIEYCWVNSDAVVETAGNPDGTDRPLEDDVSVSLDRETYELIDGQWRKVRGVVLEVFEEETSCDAVV